MKVINPATEEVIQTLKKDTKESIKQKYQLAHDTLSPWGLTALSQRQELVRRFMSLMEENLAELAATQTQETGKPINQSRNEIKATIPRIQYFIDHVEKAVAPQNHSKDPSKANETISFEPLGVIANISAWNYPYFVGTNVFIPAILTGNTVLYKPSELCPLTGLHIEDLWKKAELPEGVFQTILGEGAEGQELLEQNIQAVFFTGSYQTGKKINEQVAGRLIKTQLELGGKDPAYVCDDVDPKTAAEALADGAFYNNGQSCCSVERIYVQESIYDEFLTHFLKTVKSFKVGQPDKEDTYIGPLTRKEQIEVLLDQVSDALKKGANLELGGEALNRPGYYFAPTVFTEVNHKMKLMKEESFGPIIGLQKVKSDEEAIHLMNDTDYGLTAAVYSKSLARAEEILSRIQSGTVYWNCCDRVSPRLPWTGRKHSGLGSTLSLMGIQTFTQPKAWHL